MTALPPQSDFVSQAQFAQSSPVFTRPTVRDHYWGYEVSKSIHIIDAAAMVRAVSVMLMLAAYIAAALIWLMPAMAFAGDALMSKTLASGVLAGLATVMMRYASRGTRVRVEIDTSVGELREVVSSLFGSRIVLTRHGLDTVQSVEIARSRTDPTFGQIRLQFKDGDIVPVGDGVVMALRPLRDRLAGDCGLDVRTSPRVAIWGGPLMTSAT